VLSTGQPVAIGLGAYLDDPGNAIDRAVASLRQGGVAELRRAALYRTRPVGCVPGTPDFLNTAVVGLWRGSPLALLALCRRIEGALGRPAYRASDVPRVIDLDLLLVGQRRMDSVALTLPHPRLTDRRFVLEPLAEIAPDWLVPPGLATVASWRDRRRREDETADWGERLAT